MGANDNVGVNKKYKDTLFRFIFGTNKEAALSLYNAVNDSNYTDADKLEFTTLNDVIYMKYKNDLSFLFDKSMNLYEHQSSYNPNMPLRGLLYFADLYRKLIGKSAKLYGRTLVKIPTPKYIVFYNGPQQKIQGDRKILHLSDAFEDSSVSSEYEWTATMININAGANANLMAKCSLLREYSIFIDKIRTYNDTMNLKDAVKSAVSDCIRNNVLSDILSKHQAEVLNMCLTEFDEKEFEEVIRKESEEIGMAKAILEAINNLKKNKNSKDYVIATVMQLFSLSRDDAEKYYRLSENSGATTGSNSINQSDIF